MTSIGDLMSEMSRDVATRGVWGCDPPPPLPTKPMEQFQVSLDGTKTKIQVNHWKTVFPEKFHIVNIFLKIFNQNKYSNVAYILGMSKNKHRQIS